MTFTVAIIGRPNVGKSTLFNRLAGRRLAIVHDTPGVTRDWKLATASLFNLNFDMIDTAGLEESFDGSISGRMRQQTERALKHADLALLVIDAKTGLLPVDKHFAQWLREQNIPTILAANKCDCKISAENLLDAYELGLGEPIAISAEHGEGMNELHSAIEQEMQKHNLVQEKIEEAFINEEDEISKLLEQYDEGDEIGFGDIEEDIEDNENPIKIAIVGRPNVGKSTLLNSLLKEERSMTGAEAGITRDAVHADWEYKGKKIRLVDTAGLRKKNKIMDIIEKMSTSDTIRAIRLAQIVILVIDAELTIEKQDLKIAHHIIEEGRALVIAVNKWDVVEDKPLLMEKIKYQLEESLNQVRDVRITYISALQGKKLDRLFDSVLDTYSLWNKRVPTGKLNRWLNAMESRNPAPLVNGRSNRLRYITQIKSRPPTFAMWVGRADDYPDTHKRFLINNLRKDFDLPATPIRMIIKKSKNPYKD